MYNFVSISRLSLSLAILTGTIALSRGQSPPATGLALWVKADAGVVTNSSGAVTLWEDQSPNGLDAVPPEDAKAPKLVLNAVNNKPVIRFDGVDDFLDVPSADPINNLVGDIATFAVIR